MSMKNNGGCDALNQPITYDNEKKTRERFQKAGMPWWTKGKTNLILVPIFSAMDGMVLYEIFDECLTQSVLMGIIMAFGVAVVLNIFPLIIARFVHATIEKTIKHAMLFMSIFITGFLLIYGGTVYLRFVYSDMYGQESQGMTLENTVSNEIDVESETTTQIKSDKGVAVVILLSISPLITSLLGFGIAYVCDDETKKKVEEMEIQKIELGEKIIDVKTAIVQMESMMQDNVTKELDLDKESMEASIEEIISRADILKAFARLYLAEYLQKASAISKLSQDMVVEYNQTEQTLVEPILEEVIEDVHPIYSDVA